MTTEAASAEAPRGAPADAMQTGATPWPAASTAWYTVLILILSQTSAMLDTGVVPYLAPYIKKDLHLSDLDLSWLLGASFGLFYTLVGVPLAFFIDRFARKWILLFGIATWSIGTALCGMAQNFGQFFVARFVVGAGEAVNGPTSYSIIADLFPREKLARGIGTMQLGAVLGPGIALFFSAFLIARFAAIAPIPVAFGVIRGWQLVFLIVGLPGVLIALLMATTLREPARHHIANQIDASLASQPRSVGAGLTTWFKDFGAAFRYLFKHGNVYGVLFSGLAFSSLQSGTGQWMPIFYQRTFGWNPADVAKLNGIVQLIGVPLFIFIGVKMMEWFDKRGRNDGPFWALIISRIAALPLSLIAPLVHNAWLSWSLFSLALITVGMAGPSQNVAMQTITPTALRGKLTALYLLIFSVVGYSIGPFVTAIIEDLVLHDESQIKWAIFASTAIFAPVSLLVFCFGVKPYSREVARIKNLEVANG